MASPSFPPPPASRPATPIDQLDAAVAALHAARGRWTALSISERIRLLREAMRDLAAVAPEWVAAAAAAKGHAPDSHGAGEEWLGGPMTTMRNLRLLVSALEAKGQPEPPKLAQRADGQWVATVLPVDVKERLMLSGFTAEVWIEPDKPPTRGRIYRDKAAGRIGEGGVALVLGAGNQSSIGPLDLLYKLYVEDEVALLKMNPVNDYVGPFIERAFRAFIERDFARVVYGGAEEGAHLCNHPQVESVHITGSNRTHDAIVWGADPTEQARNKASGHNKLGKPITSELGAVTPVIVTPGPWTGTDLTFQARHVAAMVTHNASFNCNAAKVLVVSRDWPQKRAFLDALRSALRGAAPRKAYYPGALDRYDAFLSRYPAAEVFGERTDEVVPWTIIPDVPASPEEYALNTEAFCGVLGVVELEGADAPAFLERAVDVANDVIWGSLSCVLLVHPRTEADHPGAVDRAVAALRYGGVGVNVWSGLIYGLIVTTWGAFPGHPLEDIRSGRGVVHNAFLFDHPQKSVLRAPFRIKPTPPWFHDHRNLAQLGERMTRFESNPSWKNLVKVVAAALRG